MTYVDLILLLLVLLAIAAALVALVRALRTDGYGRTPPPRSHEPWDTSGWGEPLHR